MADFFSEEEQRRIREAVKSAESRTSGEIRVFVEPRCRGDVMDRAAYVFHQLKMHRTALRNGVLIYLSHEDRKFAILGDAGINKVTGPSFWNGVKDTMRGFFVKGDFTEGMVEGLAMAGEALSKNFPHKAGDRNELPDDIVFGK